MASWRKSSSIPRISPFPRRMLSFSPRFSTFPSCFSFNPSPRPFHRFTHSTDFSRLPNPRDWNPKSRTKLSCYRYGAYGHFAKHCRIPARCFECGEIGHKKSSCSKSNSESLKSPNLTVLGIEWEDDSKCLQRSLPLIPGVFYDSMLLDPDAIGCMSSTGNGFVGSNAKSHVVTAGLETVSSDASCLCPKSTEEGILLLNQVRDPMGPSNRTQKLGTGSVFEDWCVRKSSVLVFHNLFDKVGVKTLMYRLVSSSYVDHPDVARTRFKLSEIRILDAQNFVGYSQGSGDISFFKKPCKFFLYYFLAAHRHQSALIPRVGCWRAHLYSKDSAFVNRGPDSAEVDGCIFGKEKVFSSKYIGAKCKKKLVHSDKTRRSPRLSRRN